METDSWKKHEVKNLVPCPFEYFKKIYSPVQRTAFSPVLSWFAFGGLKIRGTYWLTAQPTSAKTVPLPYYIYMFSCETVADLRWKQQNL